MNTTVLYVILGCCAVIALSLAIYIFLAVRKRAYLSAIYSSTVRDSRFAYALLKLFFPSCIIRSPYLLKNPPSISPKADVVAVLKGGILIITVLDKRGFYLTPADKDWSLNTEKGIERLPNALKVSLSYEHAIDEILLKAGLPSQPIISVALLSDDKSRFDELYPDGILTGSTLIPYCKDMNKTPVMNSKMQKQIVSALYRHHKNCKTYNEKNLYNTASADEQQQPTEQTPEQPPEQTPEQTASQTSAEE